MTPVKRKNLASLQHVIFKYTEIEVEETLSNGHGIFETFECEMWVGCPLWRFPPFLEETTT